MNFNVVNALIYMLADNQYLLQLFGDKTQFFVDDIYKISYQDNGITSRFMTLHAYKHKS